MLLVLQSPLKTTSTYHIVNCTDIGSATASCKESVTGFGNSCTREHYQPTADALVEEQLQTPLDWVRAIHSPYITAHVVFIQI